MPATIPTRPALRAALAAALVAGVPAVAGRVHVSRAWPQIGDGMEAGEVFPALLLHDGPWISNRTAAGVLTGRCQFRVTARSERRQDADRDAELDAIRAAVTAAAFDDAGVAALVLMTEEVTSTREDDAGGQLPIGQEVHLVTFRMVGFA